MAEKPFEMAQQQQDHRIALERRVIVSDTRRSWVGLFFGVIITLVVVGAGIVFTVQGRTAVGLPATLGPLAVLASVFVYTDRRKRQERKDVADRALESG